MSGTEGSETTGLQLVDLSLRVSHLSLQSTNTHIVCFVFIQGECRYSAGCMRTGVFVVTATTLRG